MSPSSAHLTPFLPCYLLSPSWLPFMEKRPQEESPSPVSPGRMGDSLTTLDQASALITPPNLSSLRPLVTSMLPRLLASAQFPFVACVRVGPSCSRCGLQDTLFSCALSPLLVFSDPLPSLPALHVGIPRALSSLKLFLSPSTPHLGDLSHLVALGTNS